MLLCWHHDQWKFVQWKISCHFQLQLAVWLAQDWKFALYSLSCSLAFQLSLVHRMKSTTSSFLKTHLHSRVSLTVFFLFTANVQWNILGSFRSNNQFVIALNTDQAGLCAFTIPRYVYVECLQYACNIRLTRFRLRSFIVSFFLLWIHTLYKVCQHSLCENPVNERTLCLVK